MKFFRKLNQVIATVLVAFALLTQGTMAVAACVSFANCAVQAYSGQPCDGSTMDGNVCLSQATGHDQSLDGIGGTPVIPACLVGGGKVVRPAATLPRSVAPSYKIHFVAASPPLSILFCSYRI